MVSVHIRNGRLVVTLRGLHKMLALKSRLSVPLTSVTRVDADPGIRHAPDGVNVFGTAHPGVITAGVVTNNGERSFWDVRHPARAIVVHLVRERFDRLVLEVDDPLTVAARIESARLAAGGPSATR